MSSLLKQDTYYSEFGDSGALYTYPSSVGITIGSSPHIIIYSTPTTSSVDSSIETNLSINGVNPQSLLDTKGTSVRGGNFESNTFFVMQTLPVNPSGRIAKDPATTFLFADSEYNQPDKVHSLTNHSFVVTGD